jgi:hypothetical protein
MKGSSTFSSAPGNWGFALQDIRSIGRARDANQNVAAAVEPSNGGQRDSTYKPPRAVEEQGLGASP